MQGLKASLDGRLVQCQLPVQLYGFCQHVQGSWRTTQRNGVGLEVLMQRLQLPESNRVQQACEVGPPRLTVSHQRLSQAAAMHQAPQRRTALMLVPFALDVHETHMPHCLIRWT